MRYYPDYAAAAEIPQLDREHDVMVREAHIENFHKLEIIACNTYWKKILVDEVPRAFWRGAIIGALVSGGLMLAILLLTRP